MKNERNSAKERPVRGGASDPAFTPFVTASIDEIRYAQCLRERLKERYPNRPVRTTALWSVGAD